MEVTKALIIAEPWISLILDREKAREMLSVSTSFRGWFGLIRKGSGTVVEVANLNDVGQALSRGEMIANLKRHKIPRDVIMSGDADPWNVPWRLGEVRTLVPPVPHEHKRGAVRWVNHDPRVRRAIQRQLSRAPSIEGEAA